MSPRDVTVHSNGLRARASRRAGMACALLVLIAAGSAPLAARPFDVGDRTFVTVHQGEDVLIHFGVWNYGYNNPGVSPYPTQVGLMVLGQDPAGRPVGTIPDTTIEYFPGLVFEGWLESLDGSVWVPLYDSNAARLGLAEGLLVITRASVTSSGGPPVPAAAINALQLLPVSTSEALFGSHIGSYDNAAVIRLHNWGANFRIGLGPGWTVGRSISEPGIDGLGPVETSGITGRVTVENPEPSTWLLLGGGLTLLGWLARRYRSKP